ncbi:MAG TPA: His/Gly/Thr/Pro-type tRNA ligase C-terminal domain-containing protein, partial [Bacteroidales bacterium]|nr:His/Gly/Thr/Pro-type tRNA ligase C-terminal domain-containing protein [Bacteroidales bacterium]
RTAEFLWQEGHTAHATREEAIEETEKMLQVYADFAENFMAIPVLKGIKSPNERFAGADETYCIEALMQDGKALQAGTSHFLGQNFAKAFDVKFLNKENQLEYVWATSWGVSTRLIGALIMTHSDDQGLIVPPKLAPLQVVIIPIYKTEEERNEISQKANTLMQKLKEKNISVKYDDDDSKRSGWKFNEYEMKGVPVRVAIGPRDLKNNQAEVARRDTFEKNSISFDKLPDYIETLLENIQTNLYNRALAFREENTRKVDTWDDFMETLENKGGFILAHWDGTAETEEEIKEKSKATIRCIPLDGELEEGKCILTGKPSKQRVYFARAY